MFIELNLSHKSISPLDPNQTVTGETGGLEIVLALMLKVKQSPFPLFPPFSDES